MGDIDIKKLKDVLKNILRAYSIRLRCMKKRGDALRKINGEWKSVDRNSNLYNDLKYCLGYEEKLLKIIMGGDEEAEDQIKKALKILRESKSELTKLLRGNKNPALKKQLKEGKLEIKQAIEISKLAIEFLEKVTNDITEIRRRIKNEKKFIENPTEENFDNFIWLWSSEIRENFKLLKIIRGVGKYIYRKKGLLTRMKDSLTISGMAANRGAGSAFDAIILFIGFTFNLCEYSLDLSEIEVRSDELIKMIISKEGINKEHWWNKIL